MSDDKDKKKGLSQKDADVWQAMTGDVKKMPGKEYLEAEKEDEPLQEEGPMPGKVRATLSRAQDEELSQEPGQGLDKRTDERLRRGQMEIEARLDMHGMIQDEAKASLERFIEENYQRGKRCVLVITGKGKYRRDQGKWFEGISKPGILKERCPGWLLSQPTSRYVLKFYPARPKDGGEGALYVLLRRKR